MSGVRGSERGEVWSRDRHVAVMRVTETVAGKRDGRVSEWSAEWREGELSS